MSNKDIDANWGMLDTLGRLGIGVKYSMLMLSLQTIGAVEDNRWGGDTYGDADSRRL